MSNKELTVGIGDLKIARREGTLITYALGSCIGIALYDPNIKLGGLLHIMLPSSQNAKQDNIFKFADTGIREMLRKMQVFGGVKSRYMCKIAGGAKMFEMQGNLGNIGQRNVESVRQILQMEQIRIQRQDVGANYARTMTLDVETGIVKIRSFGRPELTL